MRKRTLACLSILMLTVLLLTGCGLSGDGGDTGTPLPTIPPTAPPATVPPAPTDAPEDTADPNAGIEQEPVEGWETIPDDEDDESLNLLAPPPEETTAALAQMLSLTPNPAETPIGPIDPIDKPTLEPLMIGSVPYVSEPMGVSFERPAGWREDAPAASNVQFTEPEAAAREGYRTMLTIRLLSMGSKQDKADAKVKLQELLDEMLQNPDWQEFKPTDTAAASMAGADGYYAYYSAVFNGIKLRGRMMVVAKNNNLYMVRVTCPATYYSLYEEKVYRQVRSTWKFL